MSPRVRLCVWAYMCVSVPNENLEVTFDTQYLSTVIQLVTTLTIRFQKKRQKRMKKRAMKLSCDHHPGGTHYIIETIELTIKLGRKFF